MNRRAFFLFVGLLVSSPTCAESISIGTLPSPVGGAGFIMSISIEAVGSEGYQPVDLLFTSTAGAFPAQRKFRVILKPRSDVIHPLLYNLTCDVEVPQGVRSHRHRILLPRYTEWTKVGAEIYEDGRLLKDGRGFFQISNMRLVDIQQEFAVGIMVDWLSADKVPRFKYPDVRTLLTVLGKGPLPEDEHQGRLDHEESFIGASAVLNVWVQFRTLGKDDLQLNWRGYSQLDIIIVPAPVLADIESMPQFLRPLQEWMAAGGIMWVYACADQDGAWLSKIARFVDQLPRDPADPALMTGEDLTKLIKPNEINDTSTLVADGVGGVRRYSTNSNNESRQSVLGRLKEANHPFARTEAPAEIAKRLQKVNYGLGGLVLIADEDPFPGSFQFWNSVLGLSGGESQSWLHRQGYRIVDGSDAYWSGLIRSVGSAPIRSFLLLNTLFILFVGPFSYRYFRSKHRLHLVLVLAPLLALVVTGMLFFFAVFSEGFHTRIRLLQITYCDGHVKTQTHWTRQTYFCGMKKSQGLVFNSQTAVYPLIPPQTFRYGNTDSLHRCRIHASSMQEVLTGDFLPARQQVQYTTLQPEVNREGLEFALVDGKPSLTNRLPVTVRKLVLHRQDTMLATENLAPGETSTLEPVQVNSLLDFLEIDPALFQEVDDLSLPKNTNYWRDTQRYSPNVSQLLARLIKFGNKSAVLPQDHFLAVADSDVQALGFSAGVLSDSLHVVMGKVPP